MEIPKGAKQTTYKTTFICEKNGVTKEFTEKDYPYNDSTWVFKDTHQEVLEQGYEPPIHASPLLMKRLEITLQTVF